MKKIILSLLVLFSVFSVFAIGFHTADEISPSTFDGNFNFINGNVGIGTPNPGANLVIQNDLNSGVGPTLELRNNNFGDGTAAQIGFRNDGLVRDYNAKILFNRTGGVGAPTDILFYTKTGGVLNEVVRIIDTGAVGIGTSSPNFKLEVNGSIGIVCPNGYLSVDTIGPNPRQIGCIEIAEHGTGTWTGAVQNCLTNDARLPTGQEWAIAAMNYALTDEIDDWEWVADIIGGGTNIRALVGNGATYASSYSDYSTPYTYRCWIEK